MDKIEKISELMEKLKFPPYDGFPDIELYMDQVVDFLSRSSTSLRDDDRLSSAMVNNYIKGEILPRARGKKYSREHLAYLTVIIRLKQVLSVKDTGELIKANKLNKSDEDFYNSFRDRVITASESLAEYIIGSEEEPADVAMELAVRSYLYKIACEYLIDMVMEEYWRNPDRPEAKEPAEKHDRRESREKGGSGEKSGGKK